MLVWWRFGDIIADERSPGVVSLLLLLMSARWQCFGVVIADEWSSGGASVLLLISARLAAFRRGNC